jgi:hypothetical protein
MPTTSNDQATSPPAIVVLSTRVVIRTGRVIRAQVLADVDAENERTPEALDMAAVWYALDPFKGLLR